MLDAFAAGQAGSYPLSVSGAQPDDDCMMRFDPQEFFGVPMPPLERPYFLAIISSNTLATTMVRRSNGKVDGFVIEGPSAGGHNAPPRGQLVLSEKGEAVYGERDRVDLEKIRQIGVPFWLAGSYGTPEKIVEALELGATGVQVGTAFAFCEESGLREDYKSTLIKKIERGEASASPIRRPRPQVFLSRRRNWRARPPRPRYTKTASASATLVFCARPTAHPAAPLLITVHPNRRTFT